MRASLRQHSSNLAGPDRRHMFNRMIRKLNEFRGLHAEILTLRAELARQTATIHQLLDDFKSSVEVEETIVEAFHEWKRGAVLPAEPLVSICVSTYNRPELLVSRCIRSLLEQTYKKIEIIVVGDNSSDSVVAAVESVNDPRLRFVNLPVRGSYPSLPQLQWCVAGTAPDNQSLAMINGDYVTHLDDDDEHLPTRIETLVNFARETAADVVWHPFWIVRSDGPTTLVEAEQFQYGQVTNGSVFYRSWFAQIPYDIKAYVLREPGDWNRFRKFRYVRPMMARCPEALLRHYRG